MVESLKRSKNGLWAITIGAIVEYERRVTQDRRDCYWLYVVTSCNSKCRLQEPIKDPARFPWHEVKKDALTQPMRVSERPESYGEG